MNLLGFVCSNYSLVVVRIVVMVWYEKESGLIKSYYSFTLNKSNFWNKNPNNRVYNIERFPMAWLKKHFWSGFIFLYYSYLCVVVFYIKVWVPILEKTVFKIAQQHFWQNIWILITNVEIKSHPLFFLAVNKNISAFSLNVKRTLTVKLKNPKSFAIAAQIIDGTFK